LGWDRDVIMTPAPDWGAQNPTLTEAPSSSPRSCNSSDYGVGAGSDMNGVQLAVDGLYGIWTPVYT